MQIQGMFLQRLDDDLHLNNNFKIKTETMKNLKLFALGLLGATFMTSCADDPDEDPIGPLLSVNPVVVNGDTVGVNNGVVEVNPGDQVTFQWEARKGDADLDLFRILLNGTTPIADTTEEGNILPYDIGGDDDQLYTDSYEYTASNNTGATDFTFEVVDQDGLKETVTVTVDVTPATSQLTAAQSFTWEREGGDPATGLDQFGLEWDNQTTQNVIVTKDAATTMVELQSSAWTNINTVADLTAAISGGNVIQQYTGVSVQQDGTYDDVLGVVYNGKVYMLHITNGDVTTAGTGTTIVITGEYRAEP